MDEFKTYVYSICITLIIVSIFTVILPNGKLKAYTNAVLSIFIFLSIISPIKNISSEIRIPYFDEDSYESSNYAYSNLINSKITEELKSGGYDNCKAECYAVVDSNEIKIESAAVTINDDYDREEVKEYIFEKLGIVAEVNYIGE